MVKRRVIMSKPHKRFFSWLIVLVLIMACAPMAITPVAPLDPNAINTFIVQTANAAMTQTAMAMPVFPATGTFAPTLTPEATFTVVPFIDMPSPTLGVQKLVYFRVKHDNQLAIYDYRSRTANPDWPQDTWGLQTPEVFPLPVGLRQAAGTNRTSVTGSWETFINTLNHNNRKTLIYLKADNTALFNGAGFPQMESLTMGGNIITLDEIRTGWGRVHTMDYSNPGPLADISYKTRPDLIHKFVVVGWSRKSKMTYLTNPPPGDVFWPFVSSRAVWIPMEYLEAFPSLPLVVTATTTQPIRQKPAIDGPATSYKLSEGKSANVVEYYPSGSNVWGKLSNGGWVALFLYEKGVPQYLTDWKMQTIPPPPPAE